MGAALLNDHAVNYRALVKEIAADRLLVETDSDYDTEPSPDSTLAEILRKLSELRGEVQEKLSAAIDENIARFVEVLA